MSEIKPRSMRMSDENYTRLQGLSEGRSLDDTISCLIQIYDRNEERSGLGNQAVKLDELDELLNTIRSQYTALLHTCQNAKEVVRTEYRKELEEQNTSIEKMKDENLKLQREIIRRDASSQEVIEDLRARLEKEKNEKASAMDRIKALEEASLQKQQVIDSLSAALSSAEKKAGKLEDTEKQLSESEAALRKLREQYAELNEERKLFKKKADETEKELQMQKEHTEQTLAQYRADHEIQKKSLKHIENYKILEKLICLITLMDVNLLALVKKSILILSIIIIHIEKNLIFN